jgi:hypothetical protein
MFLVAWAAVVTSRSNQEKSLALICLLASFINIAMTGSRAPLLLSVTLSIPFAVLLVKQSSRFIFQIGIAAAVVITAVGGLYAFSDPFNLIVLRDQDAGDTEERIMGALFTPINTLAAAEFLGDGIGSTFQGMQELGVTNSATAGFDEVNVDRIGIESGFIGYLFVLMVKILYIIKTSTLVVLARTREIRIWALALLCYQLGSMWSIPLYNAVASAFYFSALGLYYWLRHQNESLSVPGLGRISKPIGPRAFSASP